MTPLSFIPRNLIIHKNIVISMSYSGTRRKKTTQTGKAARTFYVYVVTAAIFLSRHSREGGEFAAILAEEKVLDFRLRGNDGFFSVSLW
jgi:hypothetical protein